MRPYWDFPRQISGVRVLCAVGRDYGLEETRCLRGTGLLPAALTGKQRLVSAAQELQVIRNLLADLGPERPLGLEAGLRHHPTTFASLGFAVLSSLTTRQAVEVGVRYLRLTTAWCEVRIEDAGGEAMLVCDAGILPEDVRSFLIERDLGALYALKNAVLPAPVPLTRMELQIDAPPHAARYEALFGIAPRFGAPLNRIGVDAALGEIRLSQGDPAALQYCEAECQRLLDEYRSRSGLAGRVRERLLTQTRQMPTMDVMAQALGVSSRSMRRHLEDEGTCYEDLVAEVRRTLACELLANDALSAEQIAERLGYAELASFSRAFKRWTGQSPRAYRQAFRRS